MVLFAQATLLCYAQPGMAKAEMKKDVCVPAALVVHGVDAVQDTTKHVLCIHDLLHPAHWHTNSAESTVYKLIRAIKR